jgi:hypothetical protein
VPILTTGTKREHYCRTNATAAPGMSANPQPKPHPDRLDAATDQAIAAWGGDARDAVKALIVANEFFAGRAAKGRRVERIRARLPSRTIQDLCGMMV